LLLRISSIKLRSCHRDLSPYPPPVYSSTFIYSSLGSTCVIWPCFFLHIFPLMLFDLCEFTPVWSVWPWCEAFFLSCLTPRQIEDEFGPSFSSSFPPVSPWADSTFFYSYSLEPSTSLTFVTCGPNSSIYQFFCPLPGYTEHVVIMPTACCRVPTLPASSDCNGSFDFPF